MNATQGGNTDNQAPTSPTNLSITNVTSNALTLNWTAATDNIGVVAYELYRNGIQIANNVTGTTYAESGLTCNTPYSYYVKARDAAGNVSGSSNTSSATTGSCPVSGANMIFDEALRAGWTNASSGSTVTFTNTAPVKNGIRSIKVAYTNASTLAFQYSSAMSTTSGTQLRFWVYNASTNGLKIFTMSNTGAASAPYYFKPARNKWIEMIVSMSNLGNPASIQRVVIQNNSRSSFVMYFDDIQLTNVLAAAPSARIPDSRAEEPNSLFRIYPNPAHRLLNIEWDDVQDDIQLSLSDEMGRVVLDKFIPAGDLRKVYPLALPALRSGYYYLRAVSGERKETRKVMVRQ
jgi:chitodextrinase